MSFPKPELQLLIAAPRGFCAGVDRAIKNDELGIERPPVGRKVRKKMLTEGGPRVRTKLSDVVAAGVELGPRVVGVRDGQPFLADGRSPIRQMPDKCRANAPPGR